MELKELQDKLNRKHVKVKMPKIRAEAYAAAYAKMLKDFTDDVVENFSSLVIAIFEEVVRGLPKPAPVPARFSVSSLFGQENLSSLQSPASPAFMDAVPNLCENISGLVIPIVSAPSLLQSSTQHKINNKITTFDAAGNFEFWDKFLEDNKKEIRKNAGKKGREANPWKEMLKIIGAEITAKYPSNKKEPVDFTSTLSSLFDYYSAKAELLTKNWSNEELSNLYRYVYGSYKKEFPNLSISGEYYNNIMNAVVSENLALIKSIPEHILKDMQITLSQSIISGNQKELIKSLKRIKGVNKDRAVFIARDQMHKAAESFKQVQNVALGIEYYEWLTADDERVSDGIGGHKQNNHRIFKYGSNEAIISYSSKRGMYYGKPGDRPNCRCIAVGVIPDTNEEIKKSPDGYGYILVKKK